MSSAPADTRPRAVLGPTNTGKTHYALERMLAHKNGMMGFPLRLLAREIYDRVVAVKGRSRVALITGEERIEPDNAVYYLSTVEAMPVTRPFDFVGVDEVQLAEDADRGHIFTSRILGVRGAHETLLMGSDTMTGVLKRLIPDIEIMRRPRFSKLAYRAPRELGRIPKRSAIVAFRAEDIYAIAEILRRRQGGAAIVMGALSPRTRNAQVELYQDGQVDYLVATDAIGMGLNMDIDHVFFAGLSKFDGYRERRLWPHEVGQIAGRAGRYMREGNFSTARDMSPPLPPDTVTRVEAHDYRPVRWLHWRNGNLDYRSVAALIKSLKALPGDDRPLKPAKRATDMEALEQLAKKDGIAARADTPEAVRKLFEVCQVPDFRKISRGQHAALLSRLAEFRLAGDGRIPHDWFAARISALENMQGDIAALMDRLSAIRTWTYVAHKKSWLRESEHWSHVARGIEDRLSQALHERLTQRFVDRRQSVLMRRLKQSGGLSVSAENEDVYVESERAGRLKGFRFEHATDAASDTKKVVDAAALKKAREMAEARARKLAAGKEEGLALSTEKGFHRPSITLEGEAIASLEKGQDILSPEARLVAGTLLEGRPAKLLEEYLNTWLRGYLAEEVKSLVRLQKQLNPPDRGEKKDNGQKAAILPGPARAMGYQLLESLGVMLREDAESYLKDADQDARRSLRQCGVRFGAFSVFMPAVLKPEPTRLRFMLRALWYGVEKTPALPAPGMVWTDVPKQADTAALLLAGFRLTGRKAVRIDMLERLADTVRPLGMDSDVFEVTPDTMGLVGLSGEDFDAVMRLLGYDRVKGKKPDKAGDQKTKPATDKTAKEKPSPAGEPDGKTKPDKSEAGGKDKTGEKEEKEEEGAEKPENPRYRWRGRKGRKARPQTRASEGPRIAARGGRKRSGGKAPRKDRPSADSPFAVLAQLKQQQKKQNQKPKPPKPGAKSSKKPQKKSGK